MATKQTNAQEAADLLNAGNEALMALFFHMGTGYVVTFKDGSLLAWERNMATDDMTACASMAVKDQVVNGNRWDGKKWHPAKY